jgi:hypothetical protein
MSRNRLILTPQRVLTDGLVAWHDLFIDPVPDPTPQSFPDLSGNGNTLYLGSNPAAADTNDPTVLGPGLGFVDDDYALTGSLAASITENGPWTLVVAFKSAYDADGYVAGIGRADNAARCAGLYMDSSTGIQARWNPGAGNVLSSNITIADETSYVFALVANTTITAIRLDNLASATAAAVTYSGGTPRLGLGALPNSVLSNPLNDGTIYESLLYNRVLSAAELAHNYRAIKSKWAARNVVIL